MDYLRTAVVVAATLLIGMSTAHSKDELPDAVICAVTEIHACALHEGCVELNPSEINAPDFLKLDLKEKEVTGRRYDGSYGTLKMDKMTKLEKLLLIQGINADPEELEDGLAYSIAVHVETGRMAASVSSTETVYSVLGNCHAL